MGLNYQVSLVLEVTVPNGLEVLDSYPNLQFSVHHFNEISFLGELFSLLLFGHVQLLEVKGHCFNYLLSHET